MTEKHSRKWTIQRKERNGIHSFMLGLVTSLQSLIPWPTWQKGQVTNFNEVEAKDLAALPWGDHFYLNSYCVSPSSLHPPPYFTASSSVCRTEALPFPFYDSSLQRCIWENKSWRSRSYRPYLLSSLCKAEGQWDLVLRTKVGGGERNLPASNVSWL